MKRYGMVIGLRPEKVDEYRRLHAAVWPDVLAMIGECNIRNYSIYLRKLHDGHYYLFSYFEYVGDDFAADMAKMAADPPRRNGGRFASRARCRWPIAGKGEWWAGMEEVFHFEG